jgi:uracil-DNA glycosylase
VENLEQLLAQIRQCSICADVLPSGVNPIVAAGPGCRLVVIGQAPGRIVHQTSIPWNDKSGENLRSWLGIEPAVFYDAQRVALVPMGFCFPGTGKSGDLPPRRECAPQWHRRLLDQMQDVRLTLLIGRYAQSHYLGKDNRETLTETVRNFRDYLPHYFPLPHPSPRNNIWRKKNPWFDTEVLPELKEQVRGALRST